MANENETVKDVCAEIFLQTYQTVFRTSDVMEWKVRILSAHEREMAEKDAEIARLNEELNAKKKRISGLVTDIKNKNGHICDKQFELLRLESRIALLEKALKPVMKLDMSKFGFLVDYGECFEAVREAQRIMNEGGVK